MKRIIFLNRFFFPDNSDISQIVTDLAFHLAFQGRSVHVITSQQRNDDPEEQLPAEKIVAGVHIHRLPTRRFRFGRSELLGRRMDYASFYASLWSSLNKLVTPGDILIVKTDPPLISLPAMLITERRQAYLVNWLQDLYPETAIALGAPFLKGGIGHALISLRDRSLRVARANVVVGEKMAEKVRSSGTAPERVHVIPNWAHDEKISPIAPDLNLLRRDLNLQGKFVVGYSGDLTRAHEVETLLAAATQLRNARKIVFLFVGGGYRLTALSDRAKEHGLPDSFRFLPYQERHMLKHSLSAPDVHWLSLRPELEGLVVPSNFYGIAAAGRPIIAITAPHSEIARLVRQHECGIVIQPGEAQALAAAIVSLSMDMRRVAEMGRCARQMLDAHFTRQRALSSWQHVLDHLE
jgi:glycosyltransferase involved in cell wall biosynthesis